MRLPEQMFRSRMGLKTSDVDFQRAKPGAGADAASKFAGVFSNIAGEWMKRETELIATANINDKQVQFAQDFDTLDRELRKRTRDGRIPKGTEAIKIGNQRYDFNEDMTYGQASNRIINDMYERGMKTVGSTVEDEKYRTQIKSMVNQQILNTEMTSRKIMDTFHKEMLTNKIDSAANTLSTKPGLNVDEFDLDLRTLMAEIASDNVLSMEERREVGKVARQRMLEAATENTFKNGDIVQRKQLRDYVVTNFHFQDKEISVDDMEVRYLSDEEFQTERDAILKSKDIPESVRNRYKAASKTDKGWALMLPPVLDSNGNVIPLDFKKQYAQEEPLFSDMDNRTLNAFIDSYKNSMRNYEAEIAQTSKNNAKGLRRMVFERRASGEDFTKARSVIMGLDPKAVSDHDRAVLLMELNISEATDKYIGKLADATTAERQALIRNAEREITELTKMQNNNEVDVKLRDLMTEASFPAESIAAATKQVNTMLTGLQKEFVNDPAAYSIKYNEGVNKLFDKAMKGTPDDWAAYFDAVRANAKKHGAVYLPGKNMAGINLLPKAFAHDIAGQFKEAIEAGGPSRYALASSTVTMVQRQFGDNFHVAWNDIAKTIGDDFKELKEYATLGYYVDEPTRTDVAELIHRKKDLEGSMKDIAKRDTFIKINDSIRNEFYNSSVYEAFDRSGVKDANLIESLNEVVKLSTYRDIVQSGADIEPWFTVPIAGWKVGSTSYKSIVEGNVNKYLNDNFDMTNSGNAAFVRGAVENMKDVENFEKGLNRLGAKGLDKLGVDVHNQVSLEQFKSIFPSLSDEEVKERYLEMYKDNLILSTDPSRTKIILRYSPDGSPGRLIDLRDKQGRVIELDPNELRRDYGDIINTGGKSVIRRAVEGN